MTDKLYTVAGVSTLNGDTKVRFANDVMRIKVLAKNGHTDIQLVELPESMTKLQAVAFLAALPEFQDAASQEAVSEYTAKHTPKAKKAVASVTLPKAKAAPKAKAPKIAMPEDAEDAPF